MEVSGTVLRQVTYVSGSGTHAPRRGGVRVWGKPRVRMVMDSGFCEEGHVQYYQDTKNRQPVLTTKKKLKLLKGLSKGASLFPQLGFALDPDQRPLLDHLQGNLTTDGGEIEVLVRELKKLRAEEKELKKKRKQEKKAELKASKMKTKPDCESSSSSESESCDSECGEVVDMNSSRAGVGVGVAPAPVDELRPPALQSATLCPPALLPQTTVDGDDSSTPHHHAMGLCSTNDASVGFNNVVTTAPQKRIEVCMGNKCKKSGAATLLQEFERVVGVEGGGSVVACKCMGKCKSGPNVRIQNSVDHGLAEGLDDDSVMVPANPLCIGVGLDDVNTIVARFLG